MDARDVALAAVLGTGDAQEAHDVRVIGVEELPRVGAVDADLVDLRAVLAQVLDVTEDVAPAVLRDRVPDVRAQADVGDGGLVVAPFVDRETLVQDEPLAVEDLIAHRRQAGRHGGEGEVGRIDARQRQLLRHKRVGRGGELGDLGFRKDVRPSFRVRGVLFCRPDGGAAADVFWERRVWVELVVEGWVLTRRLEAVREDGPIDFFPRRLVRMGFHRGRSRRRQGR